MGHLIAISLEGSLSTQNNEREIMGQIENGQTLFDRLNHYDELLMLEGRMGYEPGCMVTLIAPSLLSHNICEADIMAISETDDPVPGAREAIKSLQDKSLKLIVIGASCCSHAHHIASQLDVDPEHVACTRLPIDSFSNQLDDSDRAFVLAFEEKLLSIEPDDDDALRNLCNNFFWINLPERPLGKFIKRIKVFSGSRKTEALARFAVQFKADASECVAVGGGITDTRMLVTVERAGGLATVFNGNDYSVPYGTVGVAALNLQTALPLIEAFLDGGRERVESFVEETPKPENDDEGPHYHWLSHTWEYEEIVEIHKNLRTTLAERTVTSDSG